MAFLVACLSLLPGAAFTAFAGPGPARLISMVVLAFLVFGAAFAAEEVFNLDGRREHAGEK